MRISRWRGLAAPDEVAHALFRFGRNADHGPLARTVQPCQLRGIVRVMLPLHAGLGRDQRRRDHVTGHTPRRARAMQHVAGATRFVHRPERALAGKALQIAIELGEIVREPIDPVEGRGVAAEHRDRDGLLVHIEAKPDSCSRAADATGTTAAFDDMGWSSSRMGDTAARRRWLLQLGSLEELTHDRLGGQPSHTF